MNALTAFISILNEALQLVPIGSQLYNSWLAKKTQAEQWAASNYTPTDADWAALDASVKAKEVAVDQAAAQP